MSLVTIALILVLIGLFLWAVKKYFPMDEAIRNILTGFVVIGTVFWLVMTLLPGVAAMVKSIHV